MVLDEVADGLRKYRQETDERHRVQWLWKLGSLGGVLSNTGDVSACDPRVFVMLGEALYKGAPLERWVATWLLWPYSGDPASCGPDIRLVKQWWQKNEADLRRRAKELPR
jgi:hypothetical protein